MSVPECLNHSGSRRSQHVRNSYDATYSTVVGHHKGTRSLAAQALDGLCDAGFNAHLGLNKGELTHHALLAVDHAHHTVGSNLAHVLRDERLSRALLGLLHDSARKRMRGSNLKRSGNPQYVVARCVTKGLHVAHTRVSRSQRAGFIERHVRDVRRDVKVRTTLYQNAVTRCTRKRRDK